MSSIYIHIPFCKQACYYCDFHFSTFLKKKNAFLNALKKEIVLQKDYLSGEKINTIYFGGGTPSLLSQQELLDIFEQLNNYFSIAPDAEITLEANPDNLSKQKLLELKDSPINRLSIGIQSFSDADLKFMNRIHTAQEALQSVVWAKEIGFNNISIDLIYGVPTLSNAVWKKNIATTFSLNISHISCYSLTVERQTALAYFIKKGKVKNLDEELALQQYEILMEMMHANSYIHYEISNFCKEGFYSRHNSGYWLQEKYLGLGPAAHSFNGSSRQWNIANNNHYIQALSKDELPFEKEILSLKQQYNEYVLTSLRTIWGTDWEYIKKHFGETFSHYFQQQAKRYVTLELVIEKEHKLFLTNKGKFLSDKIIADLFYAK